MQVQPHPLESDVKLRKAAKAPMAIAWASVPFVIAGARLREESPRFESWLSSLHFDTDMGHGTGIALATWWVSISVFGLFGLAMFTGVYLFFITRLSQIRRVSWAVIILGVLFALSCLWIGVGGWRDVVDDLTWGFWVLAVGESLASTGLCLGAFETLQMCRTNRKTSSDRGQVA